jgi:hypothetical protein
MLRRRSLPLLGLLAAPALIRPAPAQQPAAGPPHEWLFGPWTGGIFPATDTEGPACFGNVTVIFMPDIVMRASSLEMTFRQRAVETVALTADGVEFRLVPFGGATRGVPEIGFGCGDNPDLLRVSRRGADEIVFTNCVEFPSPLKRCRT